MKVRNLLQFLQTLEGPLRLTGGTQAANELRDACDRLDPFGDLPVAQFADFLRAADQYRKTGEVPVATSGTRSKTKGVDSEKIKKAAQTVTNLYERAIDRAMDYSYIEQELNRLNQQLSRDEAVALAAAVNIVKPQKTKKAVFEAIQARIFDRKQSYERTNF